MEKTTRVTMRPRLADGFLRSAFFSLFVFFFVSFSSLSFSHFDLPSSSFVPKRIENGAAIAGFSRN